MPLNQTLRKNSNVLWTISIIQDQNPTAQTKSEFGEMANDVLTTPTIDTVTLCLADNLQRFRLMIEDGSSEEEAIQKCQELAKQWQYDNSESIQKLKEGKKLSVLTWEEFRNWPDYDKTIQQVESWYKENREFRNDVDGRVRQAMQGISSDAKISDRSEQTKLLKQYMFEECAYQKFCASKGFDYELYKTPMSKAMRRIKNNSDFVAPGTMVEVHFTQFNPQERKQRINQDSESKTVERVSFAPVFNNPLPKNYLTPQARMIEPSLLLKATEFIEKTLSLVPKEQQENAIHALLKFTNQEIVPMCYANKTTLVNN